MDVSATPLQPRALQKMENSLISSSLNPNNFDFYICSVPVTMLCMYCAGLSINLSKADRYLHQPSFKALKESAEKGCKGCEVVMGCWAAEKQDYWEMLNDEKSSQVWFERGRSSRARRTNELDQMLVNCKSKFKLVEFATDDANVASKHVTGRVVEVDPASPATYRRIKRWINECVSSHPICRSAQPSRLPTRILDVSPDDTSEVDLRLYISADQEIGDYVALSYCWGATQPVTTTQTNLGSHKRKIDQNSLPGTIRHAISVTRQLGVRFLWVDALCIVQDSLNGEDWHRESSRMSEIYSKAFVTISAEKAKDSSAGFLHKRSSEGTNRSCTVPYYLANGVQCGSVCLQRRTSYDNFSQLSLRAWAFQERRLSKRVLDYREKQISLTCRFGIIEETSSTFEDIRENKYQEGSRPLMLSSQSPEVLNEWYRGVENYSLRNLPYESDKLPALSGYAHAVQKYVEGSYLAWIWKKDLSIGLLWFASSSRMRLKEPSQRRAPSWSWAALTGGVDYSSFWMEYGTPRRASDLWLKPIEDRVITAGLDSMGQVTGGMLKVSGHVKRAAWLPPGKDTIRWERRDSLKVSDIENWDMLQDADGDKTTRQKGDETGIVPTDDIGRPVAICLFDTEDTRPRYVWCLAVTSSRGLMLVYLAEQDVYQRVGFFMFSDPTWMSNSPVSTITII